MGAQWAKNEVVAEKRRCDLMVIKNDNTFAPRRENFTTNPAASVYISGVESPHYALALGTMTNKRRPLTGANFEVGTVDHATNDTLALSGLEDLDGPFQFTTTNTLPGGISLATDYWLIEFSDGVFQLAESLEDALAGTFIDITDGGTGTHTIAYQADTQRGIDGHFTYEATQAETDHDAPETSVIVDGSDYERSSGYGAYTTVAMISSSSDYGSEAIEGTLTRDDCMRLIVRSLVAPFSKTGNDYLIRNVADTKDSHESTVTPTGKTAVTIIDET